MSKRLVLCAFAVLICLAAVPASAQQAVGGPELMLEHWCYAHDGQNVTLAYRVHGCSSLIESELYDDIGMAYLHDLRGKAYAELGDDSRAEEDFDVAVQLAPGEPSARFARAGFYRSRGMMPAAKADFGKAEALTAKELAKATDKSSKVALFNGRCWGRAKWGLELKAALADCNAALALDPGNTDILDSRTLVEFRLGDDAKAIADADAVLKKKSRTASSLYLRGLAEGKSGDAAGSSADIARAKSIDSRIAKTFAGYGVTP